MAGKRLPRAERRKQMLRAALDIIRGEGAEALTLARLAEVAGVTRPVAYEHFESRAGLLLAVYHSLEARQTEATEAALRSRADSLEDAVSILATAYVDCGLKAAPELGAITAALSTMIAMDDFLRSERQRYAELYRKRLAAFVDIPQAKGGRIMLGVIAAADVLAREAIARRMSRKDAIEALRHIMLGAVRES